ncbi:hypothetical protein C4D60_Mb06t25390 [Musa balbisiana]|uniref:Uncharacterized protein n=1 Tax=Musa balbisiana TaxID=52838 RepID=A0A4S8IQK7_MUSBA|nr:hypothetical protein C4D60_Mb06t25390 [Musa balbisiana]
MVSFLICSFINSFRPSWGYKWSVSLCFPSLFSGCRECEDIRQKRTASRRNSTMIDIYVSFGTPFWKRVLNQFDDLLVKILIAAAIVSFLLALINGETGLTAFLEPSVIFMILAANAAVGVITETNAEKALVELRAYQADVATVLRNGCFSILPATELVPGDIVEVGVGCKVPADMRMVEMLSSQLRVDQAILTDGKGVMAERARMRRVASIPSSNLSPARHSTMLSQQPDPVEIQPRVSSSLTPPLLPPSMIMRKKTKMMARARRGSSSPTWARIPSFAIDHDLLDHSGHDPFAPYCVSPDGALRVLPRPTLFSVMPSSSNKCRSLVFLVVVLLVLSAS